MLNSVKAITPKAVFTGLTVKEKTLAENIVNNIFNSYMIRDIYENELASTSIDAILGRIASLLDEVKDSFTSNELAEVKNSIIESVNTILENLPKTNATIDIEQITSKIINKIQVIQDQAIEKLTSSLTSFINDNVVKKLDDKNQNTPSVKETKEDSTKKEDTDETNNILANVQNLTTTLNKFIDFTQLSLMQIDEKLMNISEQVEKVTNKINIVLEKISVLIPNNKDKKE